eukprot:GHVU01055511.1.p1 GENE.GHVU01055511.1~~GHVU01055511.1.p1  ORF type:complete len:288 (+),score=25.09 GHVU01055511.1:71-934(+)
MSAIVDCQSQASFRSAKYLKSESLSQHDGSSAVSVVPDHDIALENNLEALRLPFPDVHDAILPSVLGAPKLESGAPDMELEQVPACSASNLIQYHRRTIGSTSVTRSRRRHPIAISPSKWETNTTGYIRNKKRKAGQDEPMESCGPTVQLPTLPQSVLSRTSSQVSAAQERLMQVCWWRRDATSREEVEQKIRAEFEDVLTHFYRDVAAEANVRSVASSTQAEPCEAMGDATDAHSPGRNGVASQTFTSSSDDDSHCSPIGAPDDGRGPSYPASRQGWLRRRAITGS